MMEKVAVITGGNRYTLHSVYRVLSTLMYCITFFYSGIGFALAQRLLAEGVAGEERVRVCLACRNMEKAEGARQRLMADNPGCEVDIVCVDVSSIASVKAACAEIERR